MKTGINSSLMVCLFILFLAAFSGGPPQAHALDCLFDYECPADYYCAKPDGACSGPGVCAEVPGGICPLYWSPVCGCDGITYGNGCEARSAGVNIAYEGPCNCTDADLDGFALEGGSCGPVDCNDSDPAVHPDALEYCLDNIDNDCDGLIDTQDPDAFGCPPNCTDRDGDTYAIEGMACGPVDCNDNDPTINPGAIEDCGDGIDNDCDDFVDYEDTDCVYPCTVNEDCPGVNDYCEKTPGDCEGEGACRVRPEACFEIYDPVCGCDDRTYPNACHAAAAGVSVSAGGECCTATALTERGKICRDGVDNDCDGVADGDDPDCQGGQKERKEKDCADGIDNDSDGSVDCADSDCAKSRHCR